MKICKAGECEKPSRSRGYCPAHWYKWRKYGDPLAGNTNYKTPEEAAEVAAQKREELFGEFAGWR